MSRPLGEPNIHPTAFIAKNATVVGDVYIGENSSVWFQAVLRGDVFPIKIGHRTNVQDGSVLHGTYKKCGVVLGDDVTVGHNVTLHGCEIGNFCLIGMGSIVMDNARIGERSIVGAGSLVVENSEFPGGMLILGSPAKAVRPLKENELNFLEQSAKNYMEYSSWYTGDPKKEGEVRE